MELCCECTAWHLKGDKRLNVGSNRWVMIAEPMDCELRPLGELTIQKLVEIPEICSE